MHLLHHAVNLARHRLIERPIWAAYNRRFFHAPDDCRFAAQFEFAAENGRGTDVVAQLIRRTHRAFFFSPADRAWHASLLAPSAARVLAAANDVLHNKIDLLGSGPVHLGREIDWHQDFKTGKTWPLSHCSDHKYVWGDGSDIKVPWELARFQQVAWLGQAYWLTGDERYACKFRDLIDSWIGANPFGYGIHWLNAMEVGFRAANWILGVGFFFGSKVISNEFWLLLSQQLFLHGEFIRYNLEVERVVGNHYLANGASLLFLGCLFQDSRRGRGWIHLGRRILEQQIRHQVHADGVNFEKSLSYHRLVLELLYCSFIVGGRSGIVFSSSFRQLLERMFEFVLAYRKPNGKAPLVGDADNGRLFRFSVNEDFNDHRHALAVGAALFARPDMKCAAADRLDDLAWLLGEPGWSKFQELPSAPGSDTSQAFSEGGFYILRSADSHLFVDAGAIGPHPVGVHGHNDTFGFELYFAGDNFITDSGTYVYTADVAAHQRFAATAAHNTVRVDGRELADFARIWAIVEDCTRPRILEWTTTAEADILDMEHFGYTRLRDGVVHRRRIAFHKRPCSWTIQDIISGRGEHEFESFLHLDPAIEVCMTGHSEAILRGPHAALRVSSSAPLEVRDAQVSPSYGVLSPAKVLRSVLRANVPVTLLTTITPV